MKPGYTPINTLPLRLTGFSTECRFSHLITWLILLMPAIHLSTCTSDHFGEKRDLSKTTFITDFNICTVKYNEPPSEICGPIFDVYSFSIERKHCITPTVDTHPQGKAACNNYADQIGPPPTPIGYYDTLGDNSLSQNFSGAIFELSGRLPDRETAYIILAEELHISVRQGSVGRGGLAWGQYLSFMFRMFLIICCEVYARIVLDNGK